MKVDQNSRTVEENKNAKTPQKNAHFAYRDFAIISTYADVPVREDGAFDDKFGDEVNYRTAKFTQKSVMEKEGSQGNYPLYNPTIPFDGSKE